MVIFCVYCQQAKYFEALGQPQGSSWVPLVPDSGKWVHSLRSLLAIQSQTVSCSWLMSFPLIQLQSEVSVWDLANDNRILNFTCLVLTLERKKSEGKGRRSLGCVFRTHQSIQSSAVATIFAQNSLALVLGAASVKGAISGINTKWLFCRNSCSG